MSYIHIPKHPDLNKPMKKTHIPSLLAACLLVWSCSGPVAESTLRDVRSYIDEYPDSALAVLDTIPEGNLRGKKAEAEFALLYSMALDKNYIDMTDDSLINVAVRWYRRHGSADDRLKAWYYQGRVYQNAGDNERAMESFTRAERYVKRSGDCTTSGMLYSAKSRVYDYLFDIEKSSANLRRASEYYQLAKDTARYTGSILKLAGSSIVAEKTAEASAYLDTLGKYWDALSESKKSSCYSYMLELALIENRDTLAPIADSYISDIQDSSAINWITLAHVYLETGEYDKGLDALDAYRKTDTAYLADNAYLWLFSELSAEKGQYETAYQALHRYVSVTDETDVDIFESDAKFTEDKMLARYKLQNRNLWITIMLLGIISLISSGLLLYAKLQEKIHQKQQEKERLERKKHEIETEMESYRKLYEQAQEEKKNLLRIRQDQKLDKKIRESIEERLDVLNRFITAAISKNLISSATDALDDYLRDKERFIYSTRLSFIIMHPKFISYLKKSGLTENEIGYCCLYCIGMNGNEIAAYLKRKSFYNTSSTIRKKLGLEEYKTNLDIFLRGKMTELD